jgi:hypothetical protein
VNCIDPWNWLEGIAAPERKWPEDIPLAVPEEPPERPCPEPERAKALSSTAAPSSAAASPTATSRAFMLLFCA